MATVRQQKFVAALFGRAMGNQTLAAEIAGYKGNRGALSVAGSRNMRNPSVRRLIEQKCEQLMESSLEVYAEALHATKRKAFPDKNGNVVYSDPEPNWEVKLGAADRVLKHLEQSQDEREPHAEVDVQRRNENDSELKRKLDSLTSADRTLIVRTCEAEQKLADVEQQLADTPNGSERENEA